MKIIARKKNSFYKFKYVFENKEELIEKCYEQQERTGEGFGLNFRKMTINELLDYLYMEKVNTYEH